METLNLFIDYIARTNLFNFIVFAGIITIIVLKLNVKSKMESAVEDVKVSIEESETAKQDSEEKLSSIEVTMTHLSEEVDALLEKSEENAKLVGSKIMEDAGNAVVAIKQNAQNAIENNKIILKNDIIRRASLASIAVAKAHIIEELKNNAELHEKLINESIETIERTEI